jgi:hypothetical protein
MSKKAPLLPPLKLLTPVTDAYMILCMVIETLNVLGICFCSSFDHGRAAGLVRSYRRL